MSKKYYVSMTDKFLSGWGSSRGKTSKLVIVCDTRQQAEKAMDRARTSNGSSKNKRRNEIHQFAF